MMIFEKGSSNIFYVVATLATLLSNVYASSAYLFSNSSTAVHSSVTTSASDPLITSCIADFNFYDYLAPSLRTLPPEELTPIAAALLAKYLIIYDDFARRNGEATITNPASLASYSSSILNDIQEVVTSLFGPYGNAVLNFFNIPDSCLRATCFSQFASQSTAFAIANPEGTFVYRAQSPCCKQCTIYGKGVEIKYWPTPAAEPAVSTLVDGNNFTYVSPSAYAVFTSLSAADLCGAVGPTIDITTIQFAPNELSTSYFPADPSLLPIADLIRPLGQFTAINYADFDDSKCLCTKDCAFDTILQKNITNLCTPQLSIPPQVTALDPAWGACASDLFGFFDPPIALPRAEGLTTPKPVPADPTPGGEEPPSPTPPAGTPPVPVNSPSPPVPPPTSPPAQPTTEPPQPPPGPDTQPTPQPPTPVPSSEEPAVINTLPSADPGPGPGAASADVSNPAPSPVESPADNSPAPIALTTSPLLASSLAAPTPNTASTSTPILIIGGATITADPSSNFIIGTQILAPGGPAITISGTSFSLAPGATAVIVDGTTVGLSPSGGVGGEPGATTSQGLGEVILSVFGVAPTSSESAGGGETATGTEAAPPVEVTGMGVTRDKEVWKVMMVAISLAGVLIWL